MKISNLEKILKEVLILLVSQIEIKNGNQTLYVEGMAVKNQRTNLTYTILNYNCDDIAQGLLHETLHYYYPTAEEIDIDIFTHCLWKKPAYKKLFQNKITELCGQYDL